MLKLQTPLFTRHALSLAISLLLLPAVTSLSMTHAAPPAKKSAASQPSEQPITLNFVNAEIDLRFLLLKQAPAYFQHFHKSYHTL